MELLETLGNLLSRKKMNLFETLNTLGQDVNRKYPNINNGGCCVYAALIGTELALRGMKVTVVTGSYCKDSAKVSVDAARKCVDNVYEKIEWNNEGIFFNHVGIEFEHEGVKYVYDSDGVNPTKRGKLGTYYIHKGRFTLVEARELADEEDGWNCSFDRRKIPALRKMIQKFLAKNLPK